jgi:putative PIN family toxin of toxin-antitoxin system
VRIVIDLNVLVSGIIKKDGPPGQLLALWRERRYQLVISPAMIDRLNEVLARPQLQSFLEASEAEALISELSTAATLVHPGDPIALTIGPEDNIVLATAVAGQADLIATGDRQHLLPLGSVQGIPIMTPADAVQMLIAKGP